MGNFTTDPSDLTDPSDSTDHHNNASPQTSWPSRLTSVCRMSSCPAFKSWDFGEALGSKDGMATQYRNLGNLYHIRGELESAEAMYQKSLEIFRELSSPHIEAISKDLLELQKKRGKQNE
ncbi:MAG: tetratricopeptide repeat protein [Candidatus Sumerlaeia bacterium]|nr:tetratricopeptide repeat protein [Candidatus Sumerlaeia bacterium]